MKKSTVIGGGTGTFVVLSGLKQYPLNLGVIVTMMDSGGSTGKLRDQLGVLPPGDLRQALVALSEAPLLWRKLFLYRFENGDFAGHNFGNLFLSALEKVSTNYDEVMDTVSYVLKTKGHVFPVTYQKTNLCVEYESGSIIKGEGNIDKNYKETSRVKKAYLEPTVLANPKAIRQLSESDFIIVGPGDMYASIVPVLLVNGIKEALIKSSAKIIYNLNLMTKSGQTHKYKASDHISDLEKYLGRTLDYIILNNAELPLDIVQWYKSQHEQPVENDLHLLSMKSKIIEADVVDKKNYSKSSADKFVDPLVRSILRHDSTKLAKILKKIVI